MFILAELSVHELMEWVNNVERNQMTYTWPVQEVRALG